MDYVLGYALHSNAYFVMISFLYGFNIRYMMGGKNGLITNYNKNFNQQIIKDFLTTTFESYFPKSLSWSFFIGLIYFPP
jgi:hypothetical protein